MVHTMSITTACCALVLFFACQGGVNAQLPLANTTVSLLPTNLTLPATKCVGFTDPVNLQAKLAVARLGEVITICSDIVVNKTLAITRAVTLQGNSTGEPFKLIGSLDLEDGYLKLFDVAERVGPVVFRDLHLQYGYIDYGYGGAVELGSDAVADFVRVTFSHNYANYGGAVYSSGNVTFTGCVFINNTAVTDGGAIYLDSGSGGKTLTVKGSVLYASTAGEQGGAIYMYSSNGAALLTDNVFLDSSATEEGGAVYVSSGSNATITYNDFINGTSATGGGAVYVYGIALFAGNHFDGNAAPRGGAVHTYGSDNTSFCGGDNFTANAAQVQGQGDNVFVEYTPSDSATSFCPLVPVGVVNSQAPYDGYSNASCTNCNPLLICDKNATAVLTPTGVNCTCNVGFYGSGYACYPLGFNLTLTNSLVSSLNATSFNGSAGNLTRLANSTSASLTNRTRLNQTALVAGDVGAVNAPVQNTGASVMMGPSVALAVTTVALMVASIF